jgi:hypothetical protein
MSRTPDPSDPSLLARVRQTADLLEWLESNRPLLEQLPVQ